MYERKMDCCKKRDVVKYTIKEALSNALQAKWIENLSKRKANCRYGVFQDTIQDLLRGRIGQIPRKMDPDTILPHEEQDELEPGLNMAFQKNSKNFSIYYGIANNNKKTPLKNNIKRLKKIVFLFVL